MAGAELCAVHATFMGVVTAVAESVRAPSAEQRGVGE